MGCKIGSKSVSLDYEQDSALKKEGRKRKMNGNREGGRKEASKEGK